MLVRKTQIKYAMNIEVHFVGCLYTVDLINARVMEGVKIVLCSLTVFLRATITQDYLHKAVHIKP